MGRFDERRLRKELASLPDWTLDGEAITRSFRRSGWTDAIGLIDAIAAEADARDHHPDLCVTGYRNVTVRLTSHDVGGISERDVALARRIDELAAAGSEA